MSTKGCGVGRDTRGVNCTGWSRRSFRGVCTYEY